MIMLHHTNINIEIINKLFKELINFSACDLKFFVTYSLVQKKKINWCVHTTGYFRNVIQKFLETLLW